MYDRNKSRNPHLFIYLFVTSNRKKINKKNPCIPISKQLKVCAEQVSSIEASFRIAEENSALAQP